MITFWSHGGLLLSIGVDGIEMLGEAVLSAELPSWTELARPGLHQASQTVPEPVPVTSMYRPFWQLIS